MLTTAKYYETDIWFQKYLDSGRKDEELKEKVLSLVNRMISTLSRRAYRKLDSVTRVSIDVNDLIQQGSVGALRAMELYDPSKGASFGTYCYSIVNGYILHHIRDCSFTIKYPNYIKDRIVKATNVAKRLGISADDLTENQLIAYGGVTKAKAIDIVRAVKTNRHIVSLDEKVDDENGQNMTISDFLSSGEYEADRARDRIYDTDEMMLITRVVDYKRLGKSYKEIAEIEDIERSLVRRIITKATQFSSEVSL